jgi:hypothetical protein
MKTETRTIHRCDHCNKVYFVGKACEKHEVICKKNPENKVECYGCKFLELFECEIKIDLQGGGFEIKYANLCFCKKKKVLVIPPNKKEIAHRVTFTGRNEELKQEWMPKKCDLFRLNGMQELVNIAGIEFQYANEVEPNPEVKF